MLVVILCIVLCSCNDHRFSRWFTSYSLPCKLGYAVHLPSEISLEAGASLLLQGLTAMALSRIAHKVQPGEFALVYVSTQSWSVNSRIVYLQS